MQHEDQLFQRWSKRGEAQALAELFDCTAPQLLKLAIHLVGDASAAEDLVQATFLALIEQRERIDASRPIEPWLAGVLTNKARELRRAARRVIDPVRLEQRLAEEASAPAERRELHGEVARAIDQLDEPYRQVVLLSLRHAMAPADIAHLLERDAGTVRVQLHRGLEKLRKSLPAALATSLVLAVATPRGLAAVKSLVLEHAAVAVPTTAGATLLGGLLMSKFAILAAAAVLAVFALWFAVEPGAPASAPTSIESSALAQAGEPAVAEPAAAPPGESSATAERAQVASGDLAAQSALEVVDALTGAPLAGARIALHEARTTRLHELLRDRAEFFAMDSYGRLAPRTGADWPALAAATDASFAGRAPLLALDLPGEVAALATATTDNTGRARLEPAGGWALLEVALEGYATRHRALAAGSMPERVALWPQQRVEGQLTTRGKPLKGRVLELAICSTGPDAEGLQREGVCVRRVKTDENGRFQATLGGAQARVHVLSAGWEVAMAAVLRIDGAPWTVEVAPRQQLLLVDAADNSPLESIRVVAHQVRHGFVAWSSPFHTPGGLLTLPGPGGRPGFQAPARFKLWAPGYRPQHFDEREEPTAQPLELRFEREDTPTLRGMVLGDGAALDGVEVSLFAHGANLMWQPGAIYHRALVDSTASDKGLFVLSGAPGVYLLELRRGPTTHTRVVEHPTSTELVIDLDRLASLTVEVVDRSGAPQVGHVVGLSATDSRTSSRRTDEHGLARFEALGSLQGSVFAPNVNTQGSFAAEVREEFVLADPEQRQVKLVVRGDVAPRHARVVSRGATDYSGWRARFGEQPWEPLSAQGVIPMDLATDEWTAEVVALDGRRWSFDIPKDADDGHVIELEGGDGRLHGLVRVPSGKPLKGWTVYAQPWSDCSGASTARAMCELGADGRFDLSGLEPCVHRLQLHGSDSKLRAEFTPAAPPASDSKPLEILLDPPRGELRLSGVVRRKSGSPVAGALLIIESTTPGAHGALRILGKEPLARTDEQGRYSIALPRTAQHEVSVFVEHGRSRAAQQTVLDDGRSERTLDFEIE